MYKRTFVSISISDNKIKLVKLSPTKQVLKAATYDVPTGLVAQGKVQKPDDFAKILTTIWKKEKIRERTVGLILPEFSTFMKTLKIPKLTSLELDEAVRWQVREFLPHEGREMILDWEIIGEQTETYEILVVAIQAEVLSGFVSAVDMAGLLPVYVETTSLCLQRMSETKDTGKIVLYRSHATAVASVITGRKILATSVLSQHDDSSMILSLLQMFARYGKETIGVVAVCGNGLTQDFVNALHVKLNLKIELITHPVTGLSAAGIQDYIIPVSQQLINPEEPASAYSINLLPPSWVAHYKNQLRDYQLWTMTLVASVVIWLCMLSSFGAYIFLSQQADSTAIQKNETSSGDIAQITGEISKINTSVAKIDQTIKTFNYPQSVINIIEKKKLADVSITAFDVNIETGKTSIAGNAKNREILLSFKQALEDTPELSKVSLPLSNLLVEENIPFTMQMDYKQPAK